MGNASFDNESISCKCGFGITEKRMAEIVSDMVEKKIGYSYVDLEDPTIDHVMGDVQDQQRRDAEEMEGYNL
jgi:hypothetical protein